MKLSTQQEAHLLLYLQAAGFDKERAALCVTATKLLSGRYSEELLALSEFCHKQAQQLAKLEATLADALHRAVEVYSDTTTKQAQQLADAQKDSQRRKEAVKYFAVALGTVGEWSPQCQEILDAAMEGA